MLNFHENKSGRNCLGFNLYTGAHRTRQVDAFNISTFCGSGFKFDHCLKEFFRIFYDFILVVRLHGNSPSYLVIWCNRDIHHCTFQIRNYFRRARGSPIWHCTDTPCNSAPYRHLHNRHIFKSSDFQIDYYLFSAILLLTSSSFNGK